MASDLLPISQIKPYASNLTLKAIILNKTAGNKNAWEFLISDPSGAIVMSLFCKELADLLKEGDILLINEAFVKFYNGELRLRIKAKEFGYVFKLDEFCMLFNEEVNISTKYKMVVNTKLSSVKKETADPQSPPTQKRKINFSSNYFDAYKKPKLDSSAYGFVSKVENELTVVSAKERKPSPKKATSRISMNNRMEHLKQRFR